MGSMTDMEIGLCEQLRRCFADLQVAHFAFPISAVGVTCVSCATIRVNIFLLLVRFEHVLLTSKSADRLPATGVCVDV